MRSIDDKTRDFLEADLDDRLDCYGFYDAKDDVCFKACAIRLSCAISQTIDLKSQQVEDKPGLDLAFERRNLV